MRRQIAAFCLAWLALGCAHAGVTLHYPRPESLQDRRNDYALELLQLALREAGSDAELRPTNSAMTQDRMFLELQSGKRLDVLWVMTSRQREREALAIRIPVYKGMIGWRLLLVHASRIDMLARVHSLSDLALFSAGQARDWPDTDILRANHLPVVTAAGYENLFAMLGEKRFDYLPRSAQEIWSELESHRSEGIVLDPYLVLHYPAAVYFFVSRSHPELANTILTGLNRAIANGKFDRLFFHYFAASIEQANINERTVIELRNPALPDDAPLARKELWLRFPHSSPRGGAQSPRLTDQ